MSYAVKYRADYDTIKGVNCRVEILEKGYAGNVYPLELSSEPVKQTYNTDELHPTIKGCSLTLTVNNVNNVLPIVNFYGEEDDTFKVIHYKNSAVTFIGYLVQDDCLEVMEDTRHELILSANDNLGLLKDVALNATAINTFYAYERIHIATTAPHTITLIGNNYRPVVGVTFSIRGTVTNTHDGDYTPTVVAGNIITVAETVTTETAFSGVLYRSQNMDFYGFNNLLSIIQACLSNTGLDLEASVYANLFEVNHHTDNSFLQQTYVNTQTFLNDQSFKSCWNSLELILDRFKLTLFQSGGKWVIFRWNEVRYGVVNGFIYDSNYELVGFDTFGGTGTELDFGFNRAIYPVTAPIKSIVRPYKYDKETFNYQQPKYILKNNDLQALGAKLNDYTVGSGAGLQHIREYEFVDWFDGPFTPNPTFFIRVTSDNLDNEISRVAVVKGGLAGASQAVVATPIEVSAGDKIKFSFSFRTNNSQPGTISLGFVVRLTDGTTTRFANDDNNGTWTPGTGWTYIISNGDDTNQWHNVTIEPNQQIPFDGLISCYLYQVVGPSMNASPNDETIYKDLSFTYTPFINDSTKVIGHTHTQTQTLTIKNNSDTTIYMDDAPRRSLNGALFLVSYTGILRNKTSLWYRSVFAGENKRLGEIITFEQLFERRIPRSKIEGTFIGVDNVSMLSMIIYNPDFLYRYLFGRLEISYKNNSFDCTLFQMAFGETTSDLINTYEFKYLYSAK